MNNCLATSSVGFYQVSKLGCIPVTLLLEAMLGLNRQTITLNLTASLVILVAGMILVVEQEVEYSEVGLLWAAAGVITISAAQIFFAPLQKELDLDPLQLLFHTSPWLTFGSFVLIPVLSNTEQLLDYALDVEVMQAVLITCATAVLFNISNYAVLGCISPLSYTVLGHMKTLLIVLTGSFFFNTWPTARMAWGMLLAVLGVALYSIECDAQRHKQQQQKLQVQVKQSDSNV
jgi:solute carrier family 35 protein E3